MLQTHTHTWGSNPQLEEWLQQIHGKTPDISVQKGGVLGTAMVQGRGWSTSNWKILGLILALSAHVLKCPCTGYTTLSLVEGWRQRWQWSCHQCVQVTVRHFVWTLKNGRKVLYKYLLFTAKILRKTLKFPGLKNPRMGEKPVFFVYIYTCRSIFWSSKLARMSKECGAPLSYT